MNDAVIVGGGPAGAATALTLARAGRTVLLVDHRPRGAVIVGEALPPAARPLLSELGILELVRAGGHRKYVGNVSVWGSPTPTVHDFLRDPHGCGWHLDRDGFDADLRSAAADAGARVLSGMRAVGMERDESGWTVRLRGADGTETVEESAWLVDATGRSGVIARRMGTERTRIDRLVAFVARFRPRKGTTPEADARTWIEAAADGWWYTAPLPSGERIVAFHTDADLADRTALRTARGLTAELAGTSRLRDILASRHYAVAGRPRGVDAASARLKHVAGPGWLAVGDAAMSFDPLSSQGLLNALYTGLMGGNAIDAALLGEDDALAAYESSVRRIFDAYLLHRAVYYSGEARWPTQPFWERRALSVPTVSLDGPATDSPSSRKSR